MLRLDRTLGRIAATILACSGTASFAQSYPAAGEDATGWQFMAAPYLLAPALDGDITVRGRDAELDIGADDIFSHLNIGFMGYFEAMKDRRWGFAADVIFSSLDVTDDANVATVDMTQGIYTGAILVRVGRGLDLYGGGRVVALSNSLEFHGPAALAPVEQDQTWVDPLIGGRIAVPLADRWDFTLAADAGGFGLGSDLSVNVWPVVTYRFSSGFRGAVGYRALYIDYDNGTGANRFAYDVLMHGPILGVVANF